jgi:choline-sulfatase
MLSGGVTTCFADDAAGRRPVIVISIDTLRADHLSSYGYTKLHTPHIDSFARGGTLFTQSEAQVPLTLPSHTTLFTSTYPFVHRVEENGERVPPGTVTLASVLQSSGYKTAAFIGSNFLDSHYGLDQGFDVYDCPFAQENMGSGEQMPVNFRRDGALVMRAARQWLDTHRGQPVFVFVHLFDMHTPYALPPEVARQKGISRYDAQLDYVDQVMGHFQQELIKGGWWDKSLVVLFSDHGEGLGDHQETDHGYYAYESTLHVPLIMHWPQTTKAGNSNLETGNSARASSSDFRVSGFRIPVSSFNAPVGLIDVAPTILSYLRVPIPASFEGQNQLGALMSGESSRPRAIYSESLYAHDAFRWSPLRVLREGKYKYIQAPKAELYDLDADPHERVNLLSKNAAVAAELQNEMAALHTRYTPSGRAAPSSLSPETLAQLESLGYLAAQPRGKIESSGIDPKDRFAEFTLYQNAFVDFLGGHTAAAMPKFQTILKSDPQNTLARFHLGECYLRLKQPQDALREWTTTLKLDPQYAPAAQSIGEYWLARGDYPKARLRFEQVVGLTPESYSGHFQLAVADEHLGFLPEARQHMEIACKIVPNEENCAARLKSLSQK